MKISYFFLNTFKVVQKYKILKVSVIYKNEEFTTIIEEDLLTLNLSGKGIKYITEIKNLETLTDLQVLNLSNNQIKEIEGLDKLTKLKILDLSNNQIIAINGLKNLIDLKKLILENNKFISITGLENLINLEELSLGVKWIGVGSDGKPLTKEQKVLQGISYIIPDGGGSYRKRALFLNGKELVGIEKKLAKRDVKNTVAYCRVKLKQSGYVKGLVSADSELEKIEKKIEKMMKKYERMINRALKEQKRLYY